MTSLRPYQPRHRRPRGRAHHRARHRARRLALPLAAPLAVGGLAASVALPAHALELEALDTSLVGAAIGEATSQPAPEGTQAAKPEPFKVQRPVVIKRVPPPPVAFPVDGARITATFGATSSLWSSGSHTGLDVAAPTGAPIRAVKSGVITETGYDGAYGNRTVLQLPTGEELWFCHQDQMLVSPGQAVTAGQVIGTVGATGNVTGPHLHLEYRPDAETPADPAAAMAAWGVPGF